MIDPLLVFGFACFSVGMSLAAVVFNVVEYWRQK